MKLSIKVKGDVAQMLNEESKRVATSLTGAFRAAGDKLKQNGRSAIAAGGFSSKWQNAFRVNVYPKTGDSTSPRIFGYHKIKYAGQFQDPQPVIGSPYVWLPIEKNLPGGQHWSPRKYTRTIGPLKSGRHGSRPLLFGQVSVNRANKPLKLTRKGVRLTKVRKVWLPVFVGVRSVSDPKRFDLNAEAQKVASEIDGLFAAEWSKAGG
ncbi:hypothetical protein ACVIHI_005782 [Bradyrhizobium sp. USDA 4524]|uniref:DUF6441 family protein n=1 Tax=unclassified Bradyrhizobium TaxID=2631580 RepID=UPI0020A16CC1|nr:MULTISPECIES: DUF6441 family protein [unclassified Bradyrhizobium]MCP1841297.1 hypothetical protein [Bradyrhizobium sp. USDA 4538]MCP1901860.1 hypothetical protein [Bradyrhizobium sp. USDA 4537]MCP1992483.1 hypothetical protein [Bradyrhizobium sp. USDA 4539]